MLESTIAYLKQECYFAKELFDIDLVELSFKNQKQDIERSIEVMAKLYHPVFIRFIKSCIFGDEPVESVIRDIEEIKNDTKRLNKEFNSIQELEDPDGLVHEFVLQKLSERYDSIKTEKESFEELGNYYCWEYYGSGGVMSAQVYICLIKTLKIIVDFQKAVLS